MKPDHRIRRQCWIIRTNSTAAAFNLRKHLREDWQALLLPAFEKAFDQAATGNEDIRIPKIELRIRISPEEKLTETLPGLICAQLLEQLRQHHQTDRKRLKWRISTRRRTKLETLLHYLRTGSVKWELSTLSPAELILEFKETCREQSTEIQETLRSGQVSPAMCFRLLQLLPSADTGPIVAALLEGVSAVWKAALQEIVLLLLNAGEKYFSDHVRLELAALFIAAGLDQRDRESAPNLLRIAERVLPTRSAASLTASMAWLPASMADAFVDETSRGSFRDIVLCPPAANPSATKSAEPTPVPNACPVSESFSRSQLSSAASLQDAAPPVSEAAPEANYDFSLMVTHAGLIVLHPYLPRFLETTNVKGDVDARLAPSTLPRAAALLHFLASGCEEIYEFDLAFIKVLLGLQPETPLCVADGLLSEADRQECETLLKSAINHWTALKKTSVTGFRNSFLQRSALLREEETGWTSQIERQPFDVLLDSLPWGISTVKLPWMSKAIHTEW